MIKSKIVVLLIVIAVALTSSGCGYNTLQRRDESVKAAWANLMSAFQKRSDLIPNLVEVVKGYAQHEKGVLTEVANARASVGSIKLPENASEEQIKQFTEKQKELSGSLSRLLMVAENYPQLKADAGFRDLQKQLVNIEDQINANRNRYIREVKNYNIVIRTFPTNLTAMVFGYSVKPQLTIEEKAKERPNIKF
jgi:LemA protein